MEPPPKKAARNLTYANKTIAKETQEAEAGLNTSRTVNPTVNQQKKEPTQEKTSKQSDHPMLGASIIRKELVKALSKTKMK